MKNITKLYESTVEKEVMFLQVTTLIELINPASGRRECVTKYLSREASIDDVYECLDIILRNKSFVPMHVYTVASAVAMGYNDREKYNKIRNTITPLYWRYGVTDPQ